MMKNLFLILTVSILAGCATIDGHHVKMTDRLLQGVDRQEAQTIAALDSLEDTARRELELKMFYIVGRTIVKKFLTLKGKGKTFKQKVCHQEGIGQAEELLKFTMALSRTYERRKKKEWRPIGRVIRDARRTARNEFDAHRRGLSALRSGLKAYTKEKKWREDMLESVGIPSQKTALDAAAKKIDRLMERIDGK